MNKFYIYSKDSEKIETDLENFLKKKKEDPSLELVIIAERKEVLSEEFTKEVYQTMQDLLSRGIRPHDITIAVDSSQAQFSPKEWQRVKEVNAKLNKHGLQFAFHDYDGLWSIEQVENANAQIDEQADRLRGKGFSPLEKLLSAYLEVTRRNYQFEDATEHFSQSRSVYGVLNSDAIVCVGYASLLKAILEREGDGNIQFFENTVACSNDNIHQNGLHRNLIIYIKDEKYGLDGYYYVDPTWDAARGKDAEFNLNYFLVPLKDIQHIKTHIRDINSTLLPNLSTKKPKKHVTVKRAKAIAKNKHKSYNRAVQPRSSFSSDSFTMSPKMREAVMANERVNKHINEYFALSDEFTDFVMQGSETENNRFARVQEYLLDNNVFILGRKEQSKFVELYKANASDEECMEYAHTLVDRLRFGAKTDDEFRAKYLKTLREKIESDSLKFYKDMIETLKQGAKRGDEIEINNEILAGFEKQLAEEQAKFDAVINVLDKFFKENPDKMYVMSDIATMESMFDDLSLNLMILNDYSPDAIWGAIQKTIDENNITLGNGIIFKYTDQATTFAPKEQNRTAKKREINIMLLYEAMCDLSDPVKMETLSRALTTVLTQNYPKAKPEQIRSVVSQVIERNTKRAGRQFEEGASNAFAEQFAMLRAVAGNETDSTK